MSGARNLIFFGPQFRYDFSEQFLCEKSIFGPVSGWALFSFFPPVFSLVFCFQKSNVQTLGSNSYGQHSLLVSHKRTRTRNNPLWYPLKPVAISRGATSQKRTRNTPSYQPKENGLAGIQAPCTFLFSLLLVLSLCLFVASGIGVLRSLLPTTMFRAPIDEPGFPPTDIRDHTKCAVRALMPTLASSPPHVCMGFTKRLHIWALRQKTTIQKKCDYFP